MSENMSPPDDVSPDFPLWCVEEEDGSWTIHWDDKHPTTSFFNNWTSEMFINMLIKRAEEILN
jgi:hypothetical protein